MQGDGIGTFILFVILLGVMLINEWGHGNIIWDTSAWMIRQKSPAADRTAERLEKYSTDNYNISWKENQYER